MTDIVCVCACMCVHACVHMCTCVCVCVCVCPVCSTVVHNNYLAVTAALLNDIILSFVLATNTTPHFFHPVTKLHQHIMSCFQHKNFKNKTQTIQGHYLSVSRLFTKHYEASNGSMVIQLLGSTSHTSWCISFLFQLGVQLSSILAEFDIIYSTFQGINQASCMPRGTPTDTATHNRSFKVRPFQMRV